MYIKRFVYSTFVFFHIRNASLMVYEPFKCYVMQWYGGGIRIRTD